VYHSEDPLQRYINQNKNALRIDVDQSAGYERAPSRARVPRPEGSIVALQLGAWNLPCSNTHGMPSGHNCSNASPTDTTTVARKDGASAWELHERAIAGELPHLSLAKPGMSEFKPKKDDKASM
jgi:hypothetical protein